MFEQKRRWFSTAYIQKVNTKSWFVSFFFFFVRTKQKQIFVKKKKKKTKSFHLLYP